MQPSRVTASSSVFRGSRLGICLVGLLATSLTSASFALSAEEEPRAIFVMQRDGSKVRQLVSLKDYPWLGNPRWSHDGKQLAFDARQSSKSRLFTLDADGKNLLDLGEGAAPSWSPDDKQLAFHESAGTGPSATANVWVQNVDGKGRLRLVEGLAPRWSPDGSQLAVGGKSLRIFDTIEAKSRDLFSSGERIVATAGFDWSPDGMRLAAIVERDGKRELTVVSADAPNKELRARLHGNLQSVAWSPSDNVLAVSILDDNGKRQQLYLVSADGEQAAELIPGKKAIIAKPPGHPTANFWHSPVRGSPVLNPRWTHQAAKPGWSWSAVTIRAERLTTWLFCPMAARRCWAAD